MTERVSNSAFQNWLLNVLEHPGSDEEAWSSTKATQHLPFETALANVLPSKTLGPMERIAIYRRMFFLRMTDAMEIDFPGVLHALGRDEFRRLIANEYIPKHPSTSYTLNHLGKHFPEFLAGSGLANATFLGELASLELAITDLMDAAEPDQLRSTPVDQIPPGAWDRAQLQFVPAMALLAFTMPVVQYLIDVLNEGAPAAPTESRSSWALVYRHDFEMNIRALSRDEFNLLISLQAGQNIGSALASLLATSSTSAETLETSLFSWFQEWMQIGIIHRIVVPEL